MLDSLKQGFKDVFLSLKRINMAIYFAWGDTLAKYRRSVLGPFWMVLSTAVSVAGLGFLWSILLKQSPEILVPSLCVGLVIWQFISGCITEAPSNFIKNSHFIRNMATPYFIYHLTMISRQVINLLHNITIVVLVLCFYPPHFGFEQLLIIPGFILVLSNLLWIGLLLSILGARFRDTDQIIGAFMPLFFFLSPVIYRPNQLGLSQHIVWLNPFSYFISLIRDPIMGVAPPMFVYEVTVLALIIGSLFTVYQFGRVRGQIAFWV